MILREKECVKTNTIAPIKKSQRPECGSEAIECSWDKKQFFPLNPGRNPPLYEARILHKKPLWSVIPETLMGI